MKINFSRLIISSLFLFSIASLSVKCSSEEDDSQMEIMAKIFQDMGLDKSEYLTRENIRTILDRILTNMYTQFYPNYEKFFKIVVEKYTQEVPDKFPREDISKYLTQERLMQIIQVAIKDNYGQEYANDLKPVFDEYEKNLNDVSDYQNEEIEENEGESTNSSQEEAEVIQKTPIPEINQDL